MLENLCKVHSGYIIFTKLKSKSNNYFTVVKDIGDITCQWQPFVILTKKNLFID